MIEAKQQGKHGAYTIYDGDTPLCTVSTIERPAVVSSRCNGHHSGTDHEGGL